MRAQMGVNLNYPIGLPDTLEYIIRGDKDWSMGPVSGNWFPDAFMGSMGSLQAFVQGEAETLPTGVEDAIDTMRTVEAAYISSARGGVELPGIGVSPLTRYLCAKVFYPETLGLDLQLDRFVDVLLEASLPGPLFVKRRLLPGGRG